MITHVVIFRTKCDDHKKILLEEVAKLADIETVESYKVGTPFESERPVVDDTFAASIVATFKNPEDMKVYDTHPIHLKFLDECVQKYKIKVQVFDMIS